MNQTQTANNDVARNAVVLVVDGLSASMLGSYGNTWFETANLNRLASRSLLFDYAFSSSTNMERSYRRFWNPDSNGDKNRGDLIDTIANLGANTCLLSDEPALIDSNLSNSFDNVMPVDAPPANGIASDVGQTEMAYFFAQATRWLGDLDPGSLAWIHSRGLIGAWDAPHQMRAGLAGEGDPAPGQFHNPPSGKFDLEQDDPDDLLGFQQAAAAQVMLLDQFLGVLLDLMESDPIWRSTLLCFTSTRGFPLGEHGILGHDDALLSNYNESIHVPMMISMPDSAEFNDFRSVRNGSLQQTDLINGCLVDWFADDESQFSRRLKTMAFDIPELCDQAVVIQSDAGAESPNSIVSIQTHAWKLIKKIGHDDQKPRQEFELYAKPDDRWEVNDVSRRCPHVVESLSQILDEWLKEGGLGGQEGLGLEEALWTRAN